MKLIHRVVIKDYPTHYIQSAKVRAVYYKQGDKAANKYKGQGFKWRVFKVTKKGVKTDCKFLVNTEGERVIKNIDKCGEPKMVVINGQDLFNTKGDAFQTAKAMNCIKDHFRKYYRKPNLGIIKYPLLLDFTYRCPRKPPETNGKLQDLDTMRILHEKSIIDAVKVFALKRDAKMKMLRIDNPDGFLREDDVDHVNEIRSRWRESETRELILEIYEQ